jgi:hypothetical protein
MIIERALVVEADIDRDLRNRLPFADALRRAPQPDLRQIGGLSSNGTENLHKEVA